MDKHTKKILRIIIIVCLIWVCGAIITEKNNPRLMIGILLVVLAIVFLSYERLNIRYNRRKETGKIELLIESAIVYWITLLDYSGASQTLFFVLIGHAIMSYSVKYGVISAAINLLSFSIISYIKMGSPNLMSFINHFTIYLFNFSIVFSFLFIAKHQLLQREKLNRTSKALEKAYNKLQESYSAQEELALERERNRIAGEIHDTVGHTLTTVLVEMEAAKRMIDKDVHLAEEKLELAQQQVRKGLEDIRKSVRTLKSEGNVMEFVPSIEVLIKEVEKHSGVKVEYIIGDLPELDKQVERTIYRALQEGLTNGIRHGNCSLFRLNIRQEEDSVIFTLKDNGDGCEAVEYGFGLSNMKCRVEELRGTLSVASRPDEGYLISIRIPIKEGVQHE